MSIASSTMSSVHVESVEALPMRSLYLVEGGRGDCASGACKYRALSASIKVVEGRRAKEAAAAMDLPCALEGCGQRRRLRPAGKLGAPPISSKNKASCSQ